MIPKILIVDDVPNNLLVYKRILQNMAIEIVTANSGQQALSIVYKQDFCLILMDVQMPEMDGFEAASLILNHPKTAHIPIIFITAFAKDEIFEYKGYDKGAVDYLVKPLNDDILKSKIAVFAELYNEKKLLAAALEENNKNKLKLLKAQDYILNIINSMPSVLIGVDSQNSVTQWNTQAEKVTKIDAGNALGKNICELMPKLDCELIIQALNTRQLQSEPVKRVNKANETVYEKVTVFPLISNGEQGAVIRIDDETEQILSEIQQKAKLEKLVKERTAELEEKTSELEFSREAADAARCEAEAANRAKSSFLANMSHEIRTPMNSIIGFAEILKRKNTNPEHQRYIEALDLSGRSLLGLINDILDLSKIEAGKLDLQYAPVSIKEIISRIEQLFSQKALEKGLDLQIDRTESITDCLLLDVNRLSQVLINLVGNALKFTASGFVRVLASTELIAGQPNCVSLKIEIEDSGIGIANEQQKTIFQPFEQAKGQRIAQYGGTGLGLSISLRLIKMMRGKISLNSSLGKGTSFCIEFPCVETIGAQPSTSHLTKHGSIVFAPAKILLVDDINFNRELIQVFLEDFDFEIHEATDGREALLKAASIKPQVILLDMKMPEMDGYEVSRHLKNDPQLKDIPLIAVTASALQKDREVIKKYCNAYISKPVSSDQLLVELMKFLPHQIIEHIVLEDAEIAPLNSLQCDALLSFCKEQLSPLMRGLVENPGDYTAMSTACKSVDRLLKEYPDNDFIDWSKKFKAACNNFDIDSLKKTLALWPQLLKNIEDHSRD